MTTKQGKAHGQILIVEDDDDVRLAARYLLQQHGYLVLEAVSPEAAIKVLNAQSCDLILLDMNFQRDTTSGAEGLELLPKIVAFGAPIIVMTAWSSVALAVKAMQAGAVDFIEKPWQNQRLLNLIAQHLKCRQLKQENVGLRQLLKPLPKLWVAESEAMKQLTKLAIQIANTKANVMIRGENGTGKTQLARFVHDHSTRSENNFIAVNMGAIPESLFESELFGHKRGSFTDAKENRVGRFALAQQGTLFLDEIGITPITLQPKLLRVLESGEYEVLGSSQTLQADVRVISATNADLADAIVNGKFRQDLLFRLNTFELVLPPLRERLADILPLARYFIETHCQSYGVVIPTLTAAAERKLLQYQWPGNIRELSHTMERAIMLSKDGQIDGHLIILTSVIQPSSSASLTLDQAEKVLIRHTLTKTGGNAPQAAKILGLSRSALYRRLEKHGIESDEK